MLSVIHDADTMRPFDPGQAWVARSGSYDSLPIVPARGHALYPLLGHEDDDRVFNRYCGIQALHDVLGLNSHEHSEPAPHDDTELAASIRELRIGRLRQHIDVILYPVLVANPHLWMGMESADGVRYARFRGLAMPQLLPAASIKGFHVAAVGSGSDQRLGQVETWRLRELLFDTGPARAGHG